MVQSEPDRPLAACHVERSRDISRCSDFRNSQRFLDFARNDKEGANRLRPLDFLRGLRIKNAVEVLCIILCWGFCG
jgi:hypothetical protein